MGEKNGTLQASHGKSLPNVCPPEIVFDGLDYLPVINLPEQTKGDAKQNFSSIVAKILDEGVNGPACRSILAVDIAVARVQVRYLQACLSAELKKASTASGSAVRQMKLVDRLLDRAHRRLLSSVELLARLDPTPPTIHISSQQVAVLLRGEDS